MRKQKFIGLAHNISIISARKYRNVPANMYMLYELTNKLTDDQEEV